MAAWAIIQAHLILKKIFMVQLDNQKKMQQLDSQGMIGSIESLGLQCLQAWDDVGRIKISPTYGTVRQIVINGMGGSALGGHVIQSLYESALQVPLVVTNSYRVPRFVSRDTLYILSSYSGTTEEVLATLPVAKRRGAKLLIICAGGALARAAKKQKIPAYVFDPQFNPSNQPRMGLGYAIVGLIALLKKCGLIKIREAQFRAAVRGFVGMHRRFGIKVRERHNEAKRLARALHGTAPLITSAGHLGGNAHIFANQINENSKTFATFFMYSELNHHLMEGMRFPATNARQLSVVIIESGLYHPRIQKRIAITKRVLAKNRISLVSYRVRQPLALAQVFEVLLFGSYVNFYLAMLNGIDPSPIPYVEYFKKQLAASR